MTKYALDLILRNIHIADRAFKVTPIAIQEAWGSVEAWFIQVVYWEDDVDTGEPAQQLSRKWLIEQDATESDVVRTAYAAVSRSYAHVVSENFTYKGKRVFGPHVTIDALLEACDHVA